jgi:hypothetical protein
MKKKASKLELKEFYGLTIVTVPTVLVAIVSQYIPELTVRAIAQVLIFFLQAIIVQGMLKNRYSE